MKRRHAVVWALAGLAAGAIGAPEASRGQETDPARAVSPAAAERASVLDASRIEERRPVIDGRLDEQAWRTAAVARDFTVFEPNEGEAPSQPTEARVLYDDEALYVGIWAFDSSPDSIVGRLARRDERPHSDWVDVVIDSYYDRRTAFRFAVNAAGARADSYHFDDVQSDDSWDAVWDVATQITDEGWAAEFRIPYSQLRFSGGSRQTWGLNFARTIARHLEMSLWAPISKGDGALVSRFGELRGLSDLSPPRRLEVLPYSMARLAAKPGNNQNPFYDPRDFSGAFGADAKYGITTDLTLNVTINPDFGQVEADPGQVNLTQYETYFEERRPFFLEGANIFSFALSEGDDDGGENLFYSRRIGRPPRGRGGSAAYRSVPEQTRILGAAKVSGKTESGLSVGVLHALTGEESASRANEAGPLPDVLAEPRAHYGMARVSKDFRGGKSAVGAISTWTLRGADNARELQIHSQAFTGGFDGRHRFGGDRFQLSGSLLGSWVMGSEEAIARTQRAPGRYFQRPDASHLTYDPLRTRMGGWAGDATFQKVSGGYWRYGAGLQARSPGFAPNDLGYMRDTDYVVPWMWVGYNHFRPSERLQRWNLNFNAWAPFSFGWEHRAGGGNVNGSFQLKNFWGGYMGLRRQQAGYSHAALRGGPMLRVDSEWGGWFGLFSDSRRTLRVGWSNNWERAAASNSWNYGTNLNLTLRIASRGRIAASPFVRWNHQDLQWVGRFGEERDSYLFARMAQTTTGLTFRGDWTFSPTLSLQLYAQPFLSGGDYDAFKRIADPRASEYGDRTAVVSARETEDGRLEADIRGDGVLQSFRNPDFSVGLFQSTAVLRWEYLPGSTLFMVWSEGRNHRSAIGGMSFGDLLGDTMRGAPDDVFMIKASYWIG